MATATQLGKRNVRGRVLGFDPDIHHCGWAIVLDFVTIEVGLIMQRGPKKDWPKGYKAAEMMCLRVQESLATRFFRVDAAAVEGQHVYMGRAERANDLLLVATVTGAAMATIAGQKDVMLDIIEPRDWKGTVRKDIMFKRILRSAGIQYVEDSNPLEIFWGDIWPDPPKSRRDQEHAIDALGLALFAAGVLHEDQAGFMELNDPPQSFPSKS